MHDDLRLGVAERLDTALDSATPPTVFEAADPLAQLVFLGAEIRAALQQPVLTAAERSRIHARALDLAEGRGLAGFRRAWPQLAHLSAHPAVVGGAAAAVLAVAGLVALRERRGHGAPPVLHAA
ncbi:MAG TPA: hypothetical protein VN193_05830 [Candidatus Angelobacter sp.]|jgi:hypothetical protein|nr:hypothetical protein [Candidatus Angelobacter sp.]